MIAEDLAAGMALSGRAAKEARKEERRQAWTEFQHKDLIAIFVILGLGALLFALGGMTILLADPDVGTTIKIAGSTMMLGLWMAVVAGLVAACNNSIRTRDRRSRY